MLIDILNLILTFAEAVFLVYVALIIFAQTGDDYKALGIALTFVVIGSVLAALNILRLWQYMALIGLGYGARQTYLALRRRRVSKTPQFAGNVHQPVSEYLGTYHETPIPAPRPPTAPFPPPSINPEDYSDVPPMIDEDEDTTTDENPDWIEPLPPTAPPNPPVVDPEMTVPSAGGLYSDLPMRYGSASNRPPTQNTTLPANRLGRMPPSPPRSVPELDKLTLSDAARKAGEDVYFSAFYPPGIESERISNFYVYAHTLNRCKQVAEDVQRLKDFFDECPHEMWNKESARIKVGTPITVMVECPQMHVNPPSQIKIWSGQWRRFDFELQPLAELIGKTVDVRVSIWIEGLVIGHIDCPLTVHTLLAHTSAAQKATTKFTTRHNRMYQKYFISYSRKDKEVAFACYEWLTACGNIVFLDLKSILAGENWRGALEQGIDEADVFQLFWSDNAAQSEQVRREYLYALLHKCTETTWEHRCENFIRPVYWKQPCPKPPAELAHLQFREIDLHFARGAAELNLWEHLRESQYAE